MLVLSRKTQQSVVVGGSASFARLLKVKVLEINGNRVKLGFEVDADVPVNRLEVWERDHATGLTDHSRPRPPEVKQEIAQWADDGGAEG
jgi:carbon storage regulator CsrA